VLATILELPDGKVFIDGMQMAMQMANSMISPDQKIAPKG
jgi:hypothetical protein